MSQENLENSTSAENLENSANAPLSNIASSQDATLGAAASIATEILSSPEVSQASTGAEQSADSKTESPPDPVKRDETSKRDSQDEKRSRKVGKRFNFFDNAKSSKRSPGSASNEEKEQVQKEKPSEPTQRKYASYRSEYISQLIKQTEAAIKTINEEIDDLNEKIHDLVQSIRNITDGTEHFRSQKRLQVRFEQERNFKSENRDNLEETVTELQKELEIRQQLAQAGQNDSSVETEQISLSSLFSEETPIENAMLYTATFFPKLTTKDFQSLVGSLLKGQTIEVKSTKQRTASDNIQKTVVTTTQKNLIEVWNESFCKPNTLLEKCYLELKRDGYTQYIDFISPSLRDRLLEFFENKHPFYVERMLSNMEELIFFDSSPAIAERAAIILTEVIVYQPTRYQPAWLIRIILQLGTSSSEKIERIVVFLYNIQLRLKTNDSRKYLEEFLNNFLDLNEDLTFRIVLYLLYQHLCWSVSEVNRFEAIKHLLSWLKELLNIRVEDSAHREAVLASKSLNVIMILLSQDILWDNSPSNYFYDVLDFLRDWLPEHGLNTDEFNSLSLVSLAFLPNYLVDTLERVQGERLRGQRKYGVYPPDYPLFNLDEKRSSTNELDETSISKISLLVQWLFYPFTELNQDAIRFLEDSGVLADDLVRLIAKFLLEWFALLLGFDLDKPSLEGIRITTTLLQQIILIAPKDVQKKLYQSFAEIADELLERAAKFEQEDEPQLSKECRNRRALAKTIRKKFNEQKESIRSKE